MEKRKHFLYAHRRLDKNEIFYIGVGTIHKRAINSKLHHVIYRRAYDKGGNRRGKVWKNIANKCGYLVEIIETSDNYSYLLNKEIELITLYGRIDLKNGTLANLTAGGEGTVGVVHSEERNRKISIANTGKIRSEKEKKIISERFSKKVVNKITGEVFKSIGEAAISININYFALANQLWSCSKNCQFKYEDESLNFIKKITLKRGEKGKKVVFIKTGEIFDTLKKGCEILNLNVTNEYSRIHKKSKIRNFNYLSQT